LGFVALLFDSGDLVRNLGRDVTLRLSIALLVAGKGPGSAAR
jgi:hypothetical protein